MKLIGLKQSTCTQRILMLLEELQVPYELQNVNMSKGEHKTAEHLNMQPFGKIPVLQDDELTLFESRCILRYIAKKYQSKLNLYGENDKERALVDNWIEAEGQNYHGPISTVVYELAFKRFHDPSAVTDEDIVKKNLQLLNSVLDVYESILSKRQYIAGDRFTIADISYLPYAVYLMDIAGVREPFESHPHVLEWINRLKGRESWKRVVG